MLVCVCKAVSDRDVARAIADGAASVDEIARCTGAGTECGSCRESLACSLAGACQGGGRADRPTLIALRTPPLAIPA
jgi:bacterioferritin-associated ferredoxin